MKKGDKIIEIRKVRDEFNKKKDKARKIFNITLIFIVIVFGSIFFFTEIVTPEIGAPPPGPGDSDGGGSYFGNNDWIIQNGDNLIRSNQTLFLNGNLIIENNGTLTFRNVTLLMNCSIDGEFSIVLKAGGTLNILDNDNNPKTINDRSNITANNTDYEYKFLVNYDAEIVIENSELSECGYNPGNDGKVGLTLKTDNVIITNSSFHHNFHGIDLYSSHGNQIINNMIYSNIEGIHISYSNFNEILNNNFSNNNCGIRLLTSSSNTISNNYLYSNNNQGIWIQSSSHDNQITSNNLSDNKCGIRLYFSDKNTIIKNNIYFHNFEGISLEYSNYNWIIYNSISNNIDGIWIQSSNNNEISINNFSNNDKCINLFKSDDNQIINNILLNNIYGIFLDSSINTITNSTIKNSTEYDLYLNKNSLFKTFNTTFIRNKVFLGDEESELIVRWYLSIQILDKNHNPIENAKIRVKYNQNATYNDFFSNNSDGLVKWINLIEYIQNKTSKTFYSPYMIQAEKDGLWNETLINLDESKEIIIILREHENNKGYISGFVKDQYNNFLEGVEIKIEYHKTFQETLSDKYGYYTFSNIQICLCLKKVTATKDCYKNFTTEINIIENSTLNITLNEKENKAKLSGYVTDTLNNTLENVKIRVEYHNIFQEIFTNNNGYYSISNIPICECLKKVTSLKEGYKNYSSENIIFENTVLNIRIYKNENNGNLTGYVTDTFKNTIENVNIKIEYHDTFQDTFTDDNGYYSILNIPICECLKKVTILKVGYYDSEKNISIDDNTILNITLEPILILKPDLIITTNYITFSNNNPLEGEKIRINSTIKNIGNTYAKANITFYLDNISLDNQIVSKQPISILNGKTEVVYIDWICIRGKHKIYVEITDTNPQETNISNNLAYKKINVQEKIILTDLTLTTSDILIEGILKVNETVKIKARIQNIGDIDAIAIIKIYNGEPTEDDSNLIGSSKISVSEQGNYTVAKNWTPLNDGNHIIFVVIENCTPTESNISNNIAQKTIYVERDNRKERNFITNSKTVTIGAVLAISSITICYFVGTENGLYKLYIAFFLPLYFKLTRDDIKKRLNSDKFTIGQIYGCIKSNPEITFTQIKEKLEVGTGSAVHHLDRLEVMGFIKSKKVGKNRHFSAIRKKLVNIERIKNLIKNNPGITQKEINKVTKLKQQTISKNIIQLEDDGFIRTEKRNRKKLYFIIENKNENNAVSKKKSKIIKKSFRYCPFCGEDFKLVKTPKFCPFCREEIK